MQSAARSEPTMSLPPNQAFMAESALGTSPPYAFTDSRWLHSCATTSYTRSVGTRGER
jgi:hypothetical protein